MKIFVGQPLLEPSTSELLAGHDVVIGTGGLPEDEIAEHLAVADAFLPTPCERVTREVLSRAPQLRIVASCSVGADHIDLAACRERGISVTNTPGVLTEATADLAFALILAVARRMHEGEALLRSGRWDGWKPTELLGTSLDGKTLGIFGLGRIGTAVARRGEAFGMRTLGVAEGDPPERFEELLARSDVLSIHAPLTPATRGRFSRRELSAMKRGAILINTARGPLVDEAALVEALEAGHLRGAGLDVYEKEPAVHPGLLGRVDVVLLPAPRLGDRGDAPRDGTARLLGDREVLSRRAAPPPGQLTDFVRLAESPETGIVRGVMDADGTEPRRFDVVVVGGAIAGASTAILLRRWHPELSVLVVEKGTAFDWKVGESTVEISSYFLTRVLKLYDYLSREQIAKQGFRYWFWSGSVTCLREASEVGPTQLARTPGFQLDRSRLDEHVLGVARAEGAKVWRPAKVAEIRLKEDTGAAENVVVVEKDGQRIEIAAGWVVDASGRAAMIARKKGLLKPLEAHPTASIWARFRNVKDLDGKEVAGVDPADPFVRPVIAARRLSTNHFVGLGYWIWFIPLKGGETSVGLVWDKRLIDPQGANPGEKLMRFLDGNPLTKEMLEKAEIAPGDTRFYGHLPYLNDRVVGEGWSLVGDAAGFLDPFYSPGLDQMAYSVSWTLELIKRRRMLAPEAFAKELEIHNRRFARYLNFFFGSIYQNKYWLMGDYDTMTSSFLIDTALYYLAAVIPVYRWSADRVLVPPFYQDFSEVAFYPMRFYQRRLISIAKRKLALGIYGNHNAGRRPGLVGFSLRSSAWVMLGHGLVRWLKAELANALTYVVRPRPMTARMPIQDRVGDVAGAPDGRDPGVPVRAA